MQYAWLGVVLAVLVVRLLLWVLGVDFPGNAPGAPDGDPPM